MHMSSYFENVQYINHRPFVLTVEGFPFIPVWVALLFHQGRYEKNEEMSKRGQVFTLFNGFAPLEQLLQHVRRYVATRVDMERVVSVSPNNRDGKPCFEMIGLASQPRIRAAGHNSSALGSPRTPSNATPRPAAGPETHGFG